MNISEKNYEEFLIRHVENDLSGDEREALFAFLENHPEYRRELELFEQTRLVPDEAISFGDKSSLKRTATRFSLNNWLIWSSVAAAILVLIYFKFLTPEMTGINSVALKHNETSNKKTQQVATNDLNGNSSSPNPNSNSQNTIAPINKIVIQPVENKNSLAASQIQNTNPVLQINPVSGSPENHPGAIQAVANSAEQNSPASERRSAPITAMNTENENSGNARLNAMNNIIPAVYVRRKREILVSKVPDVRYMPVASAVNQQSQQGNPFKDLASLFRAAVDHTPISQTSFYHHSSVGKLLATQVVYEHH